MHQLILKPKEQRRIEQGHLWVFSNEIAQLPQAEAGDLVEVFAAHGTPLGTALYHPSALIAARMLGPKVERLDEAFFAERLQKAASLRQRLFPQDNAYRLVHGESDWLPGLIVDRYDDCLCVQILSAGMERRLSRICDALEGLFRPRAIVERNDTPLRGYEDLPQRSGVLRGRLEGPLQVVENRILYQADVLTGQKTGLFLDQKLNRDAVARYCRGQRVLDGFCNQAGFALNAAQGGAGRITAVDSSETALLAAEESLKLNNFDSARFDFVQSDMFDFLQQAVRDGDRYGVIILDPPSFTRSKKHVASARRAYRKLNELALRLLEPGGILATASCSFHIFEEVFYESVALAARRANRRLRLLQRLGQSPDHPVLPAMPETRYLKMGVFLVG